MMEIKTTDAFICREHIYHALYLPGYIKRLEKALTNHEYGNGYVYKDAVGLFFRRYFTSLGKRKYLGISGGYNGRMGCSGSSH